jgi:hypothetical protein
MLNEDTRDKMRSYLADIRQSSLFGDGLEMEYIYEGTVIVGLLEMSDQELFDEYEQIVDGYEDDELLIKAKLELDINTALSKEA